MTYFGTVSVNGQADYNQSPVIFNHILTEKADQFELISANVYHSEEKANTILATEDLLESETVSITSRTDTSTSTVSTNVEKFSLSIKLEDIDKNASGGTLNSAMRRAMGSVMIN